MWGEGADACGGGAGGRGEMSDRQVLRPEPQGPARFARWWGRCQPETQWPARSQCPHPCGHTRPQVPPRRFLCCFLSGSRSVRLLPHTLGLLSPCYPCYFPDEEINLEPSPLCPHHVTERPGSWRSPEPSLPEQSAPTPTPLGRKERSSRESGGAGGRQGRGSSISAQRLPGTQSVLN